MGKIIYVLILIIGGEEIDGNCKQSLCFERLSDCYKFEQRINSEPFQITARCDVLT